MSPATLYREGLYREGRGLDDLLAELDMQYPQRVRVLDIARPREGGVFGFFAKQKVGVHYRLLDAPGDAAATPAHDVASEQSRGDAPDAATQPEPGAQFAQILAELALRGARRREPDTGPRLDPVARGAGEPQSVFAPAAFTPVADAESVSPGPGAASRRSPRAVPRFQPSPPNAPAVPGGAPRPGALNWPIAGGAAVATLPAPHPVPLPVRAAVEASEPLPWALPGRQSACQDRPVADAPVSRAQEPQHHSGRLALRRQLAELGVAIDRVPGAADHVYAAVEQLTRDLPPAPTPPAKPGQILLVVGPARDAVIAAEALSAGSAAAYADVWYYGCPPGVHARPTARDRIIDSADAAANLAAELRATGAPAALVVVATDTPRCAPAGVIAALAPDATWAVVDATRKPSDSRRALDRLGALTAVDALVVANAELSASPATVWDLNLPMPVVDGRPAGPATWAVLLVSRLSEMKERECSAAPY